MVFLIRMFKPADIITISSQLQEGAVGIFPFDTLLGMTGVVSETVIKRIQTIKKRVDQPFIVILPNYNHLLDWVAPLTSHQEHVLRCYWPGPITFIFKKHDSVPDYVTANKDTIAIRLVEFLPVNFLLRQLQQPILSTSVNITGNPACMTINDCSEDLLIQMDFVLDSCQTLYQQPSTIVDFSGDEPVLLRQGVISYETI